MVGWAKRWVGWAMWANGHWADIEENTKKWDWAARDGWSKTKK
jgi:hypothetical protein